MRNLEPAVVFRPDMGPEPAVEDPGPEDFRYYIELPRTLSGSAAVGSVLLEVCRGRGVDTVNRFRFGLGRTSAGLGRIGYVFWSSQCLQGLECGSSPTSGTVLSQVRGLFGP
ncbi:hypothetical protein GCM10017710_26820 [Arthrobacter ramosus]